MEIDSKIDRPKWKFILTSAMSDTKINRPKKETHISMIGTPIWQRIVARHKALRKIFGDDHGILYPSKDHPWRLSACDCVEVVLSFEDENER